jgi:colanic acid/amylovoran biosynthesis glycosyltransferase
MSRFPRLTETFILSEILALEELGVDVQLYPLLRERADVVQPETLALVARARFQPFASVAILRSNLILLRRRPGAYLRTLGSVVRGTWGSFNFLIGGLAIFPKVAHNALEMERRGVSHVHCHFANHPALAGFIIRRLVGIPYSFTAHGSDLHVDRHMLVRKVAEASFVVAISDYNRRLILEECGDRWGAKVEVIHCGVRTDRFRPMNHRAPADRLAVACIGTLHEVKGQAYLLEACRLLTKAGVRLTCHLVGDGPDRSMLERQAAASGLDGVVRFEGSKTQDEIARLLADVDVLVTPSVPTRSGKREGIPVVLMEAMSSGIPVIASDQSGIPELVSDGKTGLLVRAGDAPGIAAAIRRLHEDAELRHCLAQAGRAKVVREFDVRANAGRLAASFARSAGWRMS